MALNQDIKLRICDSLSIDKANNTTGNLLTSIIFALKDLRNVVAHNKPIFDVRFKDRKLPLTIFDYLHKEMRIPKSNPYYGTTTEIKFEELIDYVLLVIFLLKKLGVSKTELKQHIRNYVGITESLKSKIPQSLYEIVVPTHITNKIDCLLKGL